MIICLGPICFPVWHLIPVILYLFSKSKNWFYWLCGWPIEEEKEKVEEIEGEKPTAVVGNGDKAGDSELRKRKTSGGVSKIESVEQWQKLKQESESDGTPLVVDFTATWCKPCKKVAPFFEELSHKYPGNFVSVDVDEMDVIAGEAKAVSLPTFQVYKGGKMVKSVTGAFEKDIEQMVKAECG